MLVIAYSNPVRSDPFEMGMESLEAGDFAEAYCLWRPLAMQGHAEAAFHLGWLYANGNGLRVNIPKAVYWWGQAAKKGHSDAMFALALAYTQGEGIKQDEEKAMHWYLKAADRGHEDAREILKSKIRGGSEDILPYLPELLQQDWAAFKVEINVSEANLRAGPGIDRPLAGKAGMGDRFFAIQQTGKWYQIVRPEDLNYAWVAEWLTKRAQ
jgi:TPR repeat protein